MTLAGKIIQLTILQEAVIMGEERKVDVGQDKVSKLDVHSKKSSRKGLLGFVESFFKTFRTVGFLFLLSPIAIFYVLSMGIALTPAVYLFEYARETTMGMHPLVHHLAMGISLAAGFFAYGNTLIFVVPVFNKLLPLKVKPCRTTWFSLNVIPWYIHNALTYLVRYTFLDFITPTPMNKLFYQMMGMKIGKGSIINTSNISDPCLIEIGDYVTIGGSATLIAHYGMKGFLVIDKLIIKDGATIGLNASLMGDVVVGKGATVKPHEVLLPKTRVPDKEPRKDEAGAA
jgi:hypothetical protein